MHIRRISMAKYPYLYPYPFKQGNYYPYPIRIRDNCGYPQNIYPRNYIRASLLAAGGGCTTRERLQTSSNTHILEFIISVAHCRLDFTINNRIAYKFKNTSAILKESA